MWVAIGLIPVLGCKIAKLGIKLVLAMILLGYECEFVHGKGNCPKAVSLIRTSPCQTPFAVAMTPYRSGSNIIVFVIKFSIIKINISR
jgi:hypothetical protein